MAGSPYQPTKRNIMPLKATLVMSPNDYAGRPKTATSNAKSYYGGFFNT